LLKIRIKHKGSILNLGHENTVFEPGSSEVVLDSDEQLSEKLKRCLMGETITPMIESRGGEYDEEDMDKSIRDAITRLENTQYGEEVCEDETKEYVCPKGVEVCGKNNAVTMESKGRENGPTKVEAVAGGEGGEGVGVHWENGKDAMEKAQVITYNEGTGEEWDNESRTETWEDDHLTEEVVRRTQMNRKSWSEVLGKLNKLSLENMLQEGHVEQNIEALGQDQHHNVPIDVEVLCESSPDWSVPPAIENPAPMRKEMMLRAPKEGITNEEGVGQIEC
ncbi:hypothetical protein PIB30_088550, partial [Stylosanthes scabra]|nr:hypothetical protein [Stylosanthes scabra]